MNSLFLGEEIYARSKGPAEILGFLGASSQASGPQRKQRTLREEKKAERLHAWRREVANRMQDDGSE